MNNSSKSSSSSSSKSLLLLPRRGLIYLLELQHRLKLCQGLHLRLRICYVCCCLGCRQRRHLLQLCCMEVLCCLETWKGQEGAQVIACGDWLHHQHQAWELAKCRPRALLSRN